MYQQVKGRFEGKIECPSCHNKDWEQFLYISAGDSITAGCKRCAHLQEFKTELQELYGDNLIKGEYESSGPMSTYKEKDSENRGDRKDDLPR